MRDRLRFAAVWLLMSLGATGGATGQVQFERVLLPIVTFNPLPGAFGSLWESSLWIRNDAADFVKVFGFDRNCFIPECPLDQVSPIRSGTTIHPRSGTPANFPGRFLFVESLLAERISFGLRFRDLSRQAETWGTEIPVVREREFRSDYVSLLDVPVTEGFRQVLRVYELNGVDVRDARVRIRAFRLNPGNITADGVPPPDPLLGEREFQLQFVQVPSQYNPAYFAIGDLRAIAPLGDSTRIALKIEPVTPGLRLWAFVTIVNNETQHATVITPQ